MLGEQFNRQPLVMLCKVQSLYLMLDRNGIYDLSLSNCFQSVPFHGFKFIPHTILLNSIIIVPCPSKTRIHTMGYFYSQCSTEVDT